MGLTIVDLGCFDCDGDHDSLRELAVKYRPERLYGFDPQEIERVRVLDAEGAFGVIAEIKPLAAATWDGQVSFILDGTSSRIGDGEFKVECFDFPKWFHELTCQFPTDRFIVKMDVEGAEYPLLSALHLNGWDTRIDLLLIEWHPNAWLDCRMVDWWL